MGLSTASTYNMSLVLASGSAYRRKLLLRLGHEFVVVSPDVDESRRSGEAPRELATRLARAKAEAVAAVHPDDFVIGSDQVIALGDEVFHKPGSAPAAMDQLERLSGQTHELITAVCVISPGGRAEDVMVHEMTMRRLAASEITAYVYEDEPYDCAGSYKIEEGGVRLFDRMRGDDHTSIVGLPLTIVRRLLDELGFEPEDR